MQLFAYCDFFLSILLSHDSRLLPLLAACSLQLSSFSNCRSFPIFADMETIPKADCLKIGYLQKPHGIKGEIALQFEPEYEASIDEMPTLFLEIDGLLVPYFLRDEGLRFRSSETALVHFDWVDDEDQARKLTGLSVYILKDDYINEGEEVSLHQLVGYTLFDSTVGKIGPITQVDDYSGNLIITVQFGNNEVLVPLSNDFLTRLDEDAREIEMDCPEGIFDL